MPDYDVAAVSLSQPPNPGSVTTYRPAIRVRNNGIHDALAWGYLRIYQAGTLIFSTDVYSGTITPGDEKDAQAADYWTPPAQGTYIVQGYISCTNDQYEPNNTLQPVQLVIGATPPPPPPPVEAHASQHEEDGSDEVNVDGLQGKLSDDQNPVDHASDHEAGGDDELNVNNLHGTLADGQPVAAHGNEKHTSAFATTAQLADHNSSGTAHQGVLQQIAQKGQVNGYCPLDSGAMVPAANLPAPAAHAASHESGGADELNVDGIHGHLADKQDSTTHHLAHELGGEDEITLNGMSGLLADPQTPAAHGNEAHSVAFAASPHGNESHDPDFALATLVARSNPLSGSYFDNDEHIILQVEIPEVLNHQHDVYQFLMHCGIPSVAAPGPNFLIRLHAGPLGTTADPTVWTATLPCNTDPDASQTHAMVSLGDINIWQLNSAGMIHRELADSAGRLHYMVHGSADNNIALTNYLSLSVQSQPGCSTYFYRGSWVVHGLWRA